MDHAILEVCIASVEDAVASQAGGADRLELNAALSLGGLTPSLGSLLEVKRTVSLPVLTMIRPRPAGFCYSESEFNVILRDLDLAFEHGADGVVFGVLHENGSIDIERCRELVRRCESHPAIFHRAFDVTPDPTLALEQLIDLGFVRVMSSGQERGAPEGADLLRTMIEQAAGRIEILPAGGVNANTVKALVKQTRCDQVHASLRGLRSDRSTSARPQVRFGAAGMSSEDSFECTQREAVREMRRLLDES